jgi:hypothetical protein
MTRGECPERIGALLERKTEKFSKEFWRWRRPFRSSRRSRCGRCAGTSPI